MSEWKTNRRTRKPFRRGHGVPQSELDRVREDEVALANLRNVDTEWVYELNDIFEEVNHRNIKDVLEENVAYVLKREKLLGPGMSVVIPEGGYDYNLESDENSLGYANASWELFAHDGNTILAVGNVSGTIAPELLDVEVQVTEVRA